MCDTHISILYMHRTQANTSAYNREYHQQLKNKQATKRATVSKSKSELIVPNLLCESFFTSRLGITLR